VLREAHKRERFEELARPQLGALFRTALRLVGQRAVAEEIVQDACLRAFASFNPAEEPTAFRPWLFRIAVNLALDHLRRMRREASRTEFDAATGSAVADATLTGHPHVQAEGQDIGRALAAALAGLSPDLRAVTVLVLVEEMSYAEAAVALSITVDLVRSRLSRARDELRRRLAAHGADLVSEAMAAPMPATRRGAS